MDMIRLMTHHPASVGETYFQHLLFATRFGASMILGGLACCLHGLLPFLCTSTGSRIVLALHGRIRSRGRGISADIPSQHSPSQHSAVPPVTAEWVI
jgi:hypothetical protein